MRIGIIGLVLCALGSIAGADGIPECPKHESIALGTRTAATLNTRYTLEKASFHICVDRALYPYSSGKGHQLMACFIIANGNKPGQRSCVTQGKGFYIDRHGYRITIWMRTRRFGESSDVWLQIDPIPKPKTT